MCTPESADCTRIYKLVARDDLAGDPVRIAQTVVDEDLILAEDLAVLERYARMEIHLDPRVEVHTKGDRLSLAWRRLLAEWQSTVDATAPAEHLSYAPDRDRLGGASDGAPRRTPGRWPPRSDEGRAPRCRRPIGGPGDESRADDGSRPTSAARAPTVAAPDSPDTMPWSARRRMPVVARSSPPATNQSKPADTDGQATGDGQTAVEPGHDRAVRAGHLDQLAGQRRGHHAVGGVGLDPDEHRLVEPRPAEPLGGGGGEGADADRDEHHVGRAAGPTAASCSSISAKIVA